MRFHVLALWCCCFVGAPTQASPDAAAFEDAFSRVMATCPETSGSLSMVCDPSNYLTPEQRVDVLSLEVALATNRDLLLPENEECANAKGHQLAVLVVDKMELPSGMSKEMGARLYAKRAHDTWGVGAASCNNGMVLFLSIQDRRVYLSTGAANSRLVDPRVSKLVQNMKPHLRAEEYHQAVRVAIQGLEQALLEEPGSMDSLVPFVFFGTLISCAAAGGVLNARKQAEYRACRLKLTKIEKELANLKESKFNTKTCPICLQDFDEAKPNDQKTKLLRCGHRFCRSCIETWFKTKSAQAKLSCPVCRDDGNDTKSQVRKRRGGHTRIQDGSQHARSRSSTRDRSRQTSTQQSTRNSNFNTANLGSSSSSSSSSSCTQTCTDTTYTRPEPPSTAAARRDLNFRLLRLHTQHPSIVTTSTLDRWAVLVDQPSAMRETMFSSSEEFVSRNPDVQSSSSSSSGSAFDGGSSFGGGGGGGSW